MFFFPLNKLSVKEEESLLGTIFFSYLSVYYVSVLLFLGMSYVNEQVSENVNI